MTQPTVTIEECIAKYWPSGCEYFFHIVGDRLPERNAPWFSPFEFHRLSTATWSHDGDFPLRLDFIQPHMRPIVAAVAARHFRNKGENSLGKGYEHVNQYIANQHAAEESIEAAKQWEKLCDSL